MPISARPWRRNSEFGPGRRVPLDRERRAVWKARLELHRRAGRLTALHAAVGLALLRRLGQDGRLDPSHDTIADDAGAGARTVRRALARLSECGLAVWTRRLIRVGWRAAQISNAYALTTGEPAQICVRRCDGQAGRGTLRRELSVVRSAVIEVPDGAQRALAERRRTIEGRLLMNSRAPAASEATIG